VQFDEVVRQRRMVRNYAPTPLPADILERVLSAALRGPSAGFAQGVDLLVLDEPAQTRQFFALTSDPEFVAEPGAMRGLLAAPVIVVALGDPSAYVERYAQADKSHSSLAGQPIEAWPVPYWLVDSSFAVMLLLLAATDEGLGALFFRLHRDPAALLEAFGVPPDKQPIGAIALGFEEPVSAAGPDRPKGSPSRRARRAMSEVVHKGRW
jgi:nitroreductase